MYHHKFTEILIPYVMVLRCGALGHDQTFMNKTNALLFFIDRKKSFNQNKFTVLTLMA